MNKTIKEILEIQEDIDYKKLSIEDILLLKEYIEKLEKKVELYQDTTTFGDYVGAINNLIESQCRIKKAIKFIKEELFFEDPFGEGEHTFLEDINVEYYKNLLKILQGSDKE